MSEPVVQSRPASVHALLQQLGPSAAAFQARFPWPALLIEPLGEGERERIETPSKGTPRPDSDAFGRTTASLRSSAVLGAGKGMGSLVNPDARVEWLTKSDRNPFASLITLGRARNNDLILLYPTVSKLHAVFTQIGGRWFIEDRNSTNGTFLNGVRLSAGEKQPLGDGVGMRFGVDAEARFFEPSTLWSFCTLVTAGA